MARKANGKRFCKLVLTENGSTTTLVSRDAHGHLQQHNPNLHYRQVPYSGVHLAEMLLNPKEPDRWITKRDAILVVIGIFVYELISILAEETALALT